MAAPPPPPMPPHRMEDGGPRHMVEPQPQPWHVICLNVLNTITQLAIGSVAFSVFFFMNTFTWIQYTPSFTQHVYLCVTGYVILMTQAVLSYNPHTGWANNLMYPQKRIAHWILQVTGSVLAIAGSVIKIADMEDNFQTAHGILGSIAMLLTILNLIGGLVNLRLSKIMNNVLIKTLHAFVGCVTLTIAYISLCLAFDDVIRTIAGNSNANVCIIISIYIIGSTLVMTFISMIRQFRK